MLVYIDDLIIYSQTPKIAKELYSKLSKIHKMKQTGILKPGKRGQLEYFGRVIVRATEEGPNTWACSAFRNEVIGQKTNSRTINHLRGPRSLVNLPPVCKALSLPHQAVSTSQTEGSEIEPPSRRPKRERPLKAKGSQHTACKNT